MKLLLTALLFMSMTAHAASTKKFGAPVKITEVTSLAHLMKTTKTAKSAEVVLSGEIKKVCQKKGCWMMLQDGEKLIRVKFKDYKFFIPKDSSGTKVKAQGHMLSKFESVEDQKHYLKDEGQPEKEIAKIKKVKMVYSFIASGVEITR